MVEMPSEVKEPVPLDYMMPGKPGQSVSREARGDARQVAGMFELAIGQ
jgi:hypothetical protein